MKKKEFINKLNKNDEKYIFKVKTIQLTLNVNLKKNYINIKK